MSYDEFQHFIDKAREHANPADMVEEMRARFSFWVDLAKLKDTYGVDTDLMYVQLESESHPAVQGLTSGEFTREIDSLVWAPAKSASRSRTATR